MIRTAAIALLSAIALLGAMMIYDGLGNSKNALLYGLPVLGGSVFAIALLQGQHRQEQISRQILTELERDGYSPSPTASPSTPAG
jgi:hypothetical protein